jgi:hypothetical protein
MMDARLQVKLKYQAWTIPRAREATLTPGKDFSRSVLRSSEILLQNNAMLRNAARIGFVPCTYEKQAVQRSENIRNSLGLNYKSAALTS